MTIYVTDMRLLPVIAAFFLAFFLLPVPVPAAPAEGGFLRAVDLGHGAVTMLSMTSDGSFVSAAAQDGSILLLSRNTGPAWTYFNTKSNAKNAVAVVHPLGTRVLGATGSAVYFVSDSGRELWSDQRVNQASVYFVGISTDGYGYSTAGNNFYFFDRDNNPIFSLRTASATWRFAISPDGTYVALGTSDPDHRLYLYDRNQSLRFTFDPKDSVSDVDVAYRGSRVVAGAGSNLYVFSQNGALIGAYDCGSPLNGVSMSRDGTRIAVGTQDGSVKIISDEGVVLWQNRTNGRVYDVALSSDGTQLAVAVDRGVWWFAPDIPAMNPGIPDSTPGTVAVSSTPAGAGVFIDNIYRGITPITVTGLGTGDHSVLIRREGYADWSATVTTIPDKTFTLAATLAGVTPSPTHAPAPVAAALGAIVLCGILVLRRRN
jgi:MYXO-CTERM domain-containing protein